MKRVEPRRARRRVIPGRDAERKRVSMDEVMADFTIEELREFLAADSLEVPIDPAFKERLRRMLWDLVQAQARIRRGDA